MLFPAVPDRHLAGPEIYTGVSSGAIAAEK